MKEVSVMTVEEALVKTNCYISEMKHAPAYNPHQSAQKEENLEFAKVVKEALEKQIAQKPLPEEKFYGNGKCPNCNAVFLDRSTNFCGHCGQKLDWSD